MVCQRDAVRFLNPGGQAILVRHHYQTEYFEVNIGTMAIQVVEFSNEGYKIRKVLHKNQGLIKLLCMSV